MALHTRSSIGLKTGITVMATDGFWAKQYQSEIRKEILQSGLAAILTFMNKKR